mgnify:CR=1 FL=1
MRQAQAVRRTGLSLSQQRSTAEGLLDFEKTMTSQLELQILTGKDINLLEAQRLAAAGDTQGAFRLMQKEMGKLSAAEMKMPFIRNKMLEVLGMSYEQYLEMGNEQARQAAALEKERKMVKLLKAETDVFHKAKRNFFKDENDFSEKLNKDQKNDFKNSYLKYIQDSQYQKDLAQLRLKNITGEKAQQRLLNIKINEFSEQQIQNARARAGFIDKEIKDFSNLRTTSEAFEDTMKLLKSQFASLVNTGVIEKLTTGLVDFAQRTAEVGLGRATLGFGGDSVAARQTAELENNKNLTKEQRARFDAIKDIANPGFFAEVIRYLGYGSGIGSMIGSEMQGMRIDNAQAELTDLYLSSNTSEGMEEARRIEAANAKKVDDFILRPGQPPIKFNKGDILMGGTQLGMGGGKIQSLLEELLAETKAGKVIKMDTVTVATSLKRNAIKMNT